MAGDKAIGIKGGLAAAALVELQTPNGSANQLFEIDGDSILLSANRNLVVAVQNARGTNRTPLTLVSRNLSDEEFWRFSAVDGSQRRPTNGFIRVPQDTDLQSAVRWAKWGTVIEIDGGQSINLTGIPALVISAGVTIRGDRTGERLGPEVFAQNKNGGTLFDVQGNQTRITGLRIRGNTRSTDGNTPETNGILAHDKNVTFIDHNDISDWTVSAVNVTNDGAVDTRDPRTRPQTVRVVRNFIHHNEHAGLGYGVVVSSGAFPLIEGNTFLTNRHAIAGDGSPASGYRARFNLVQFQDPGYGITNHVEQDFDMHGTGNSCGEHCGGAAGAFIDIGMNTFLGDNRKNFVLRGEPSLLAEFHQNIMLGDQGNIDNKAGAKKFTIVNNVYKSPNPADNLAVGDFDGDGVDDLFMATGAAWYYAPAANGEWRFIAARNEKMNALLFGDFDGDGRTDVFINRNGDWFVSWGGISAWEKLNHVDPALGQPAVGDFDGDGHADIFLADGKQWRLSKGAKAIPAFINTSSFRISDVRFGDFNGDHKTDVFGVEGNAWRVTPSGLGDWVLLRSKLTDNVSNLLVADFNGDGRADLATFRAIAGNPIHFAWQVSFSGQSEWNSLGTFSEKPAALGRFAGHHASDIVMWNGLYLDISEKGTGSPHRQSRQDMR
jgi:hypothetical protein